MAPDSRFIDASGKNITLRELSVASGTFNEGEDEHLLQISSDTIAPKISIRNLKRFADTGNLILSGVSLDIQAGTVVGIIGPSGSGKSTLLRSLNRLWEPPPDSVFVDGVDITTINVLSVRRRIGMLFQLPALFDGTVSENVNFGPGLRGETLPQNKIEELLKLADLDASFAAKSVVGLSVGQAQRVALARTLANDPEVLLLDEPTSALDPVSTHNIEESIVKLCRRKRLTSVLVSHSVKQVQRIADVVCILVNGEVVEIVHPDQLAHSTHPLVKQFLEAS